MKNHSTHSAVLNSEKELNQYLLDSFGNNLKQAIKSTVQILVRAEMEKLRQEINERLQFNGSYDRHLVSPIGKIENIPVARFRTGNAGYGLQTMKIFDQEKENFYHLVAHMHAAGISQRKVDRLGKLLFGKGSAPATTKQVFEELLEQEAFQLNKQPLHGFSLDYLYFDGLWQTVKGALTGEAKQQVVLAVSGYSVERDAHRFLGFTLASAEDEESWKKTIIQLQSRGLDFSRIKLAVADGAGGLLAALEDLVPGMPVQLCLVHRYRNVLKHTGHRNKRAMADDLKRLTRSESKEEFLQHAKKMEQKWQVAEPRAIVSLTWKLELSTTYFQFPKEHGKLIRTTNKLERSFREIRRRTAIQSHHFQSNHSAENYINAAMAFSKITG
jgi:putative transposase